MNEDFIALVSAERLHVDNCIGSLEVVKNNTDGLAGRELSLAYTKLQEAQMWLDKAQTVGRETLNSDEVFYPGKQSGINSDLESDKQ